VLWKLVVAEVDGSSVCRDVYWCSGRVGWASVDRDVLWKLVAVEVDGSSVGRHLCWCSGRVGWACDDLGVLWKLVAEVDGSFVGWVFCSLVAVGCVAVDAGVSPAFFGVDW
jgi:hypothetical protein